MNRTQTLAVAVLALLLPLTSTAFASDRGHEDRGQGRPDHARGHDYGHGHGYRRHHYGHHNRHHYRHGHHGYHHDTGYYNYSGHGGARVVLPFPPLPPFPVLVLNKKHHAGHVELHRPY